ncbi:uncharacterized protein EV422DRAFT_350765 [Fimicolochytrium jonesii]|uniref:uncharacterized protein n=1 Tax=Fimicolochytrium jonesii TaxID=1396493 RepID=UPI0022FDB26F|nr:uncharacterized protein EV422DRAFT_350765 [Fimicolochytrium jonesii]KAI8823344.1 hypothetical protein EV422DRAFT_350765 [Fimicolochytrium jonesii]
MSGRPSRLGTPADFSRTDETAQLTWWTPVVRWEKKWVTPVGATGPSILPKGLTHEPRILKYVKVSEKRRPSFVDDDEGSLSPEPSNAELEQEEDNAQPATHDLEGDNASEEDLDADADPDGDTGTVEELQRQERPDNVDEMEQLESTQLIVEEAIEMSGAGRDLITAKDVEEALSHPMQSSPHVRHDRAASPKKSPLLPVSPQKVNVGLAQIEVSPTGELEVTEPAAESRTTGEVAETSPRQGGAEPAVEGDAIKPEEDIDIMDDPMVTDETPAQS